MDNSLEGRAPCPRLLWNEPSGSETLAEPARGTLVPSEQRRERQWSQLLAFADCQVGECAQELLDRCRATVTGPVDLVRCTLAWLGLHEGGTYRAILDAARERGLGLCPDTVAPEIRLAYVNQPRGEWLLVATRPIKDGADEACLFAVDRDEGSLRLRAVAVPAARRFHPRCELIFRAKSARARRR